MVAAFRTNLMIIFQRFAPYDLAAGLAFQPKAFGANPALAFFRRHPRFIACEPSHFAFFSVTQLLKGILSWAHPTQGLAFGGSRFLLVPDGPVSVLWAFGRARSGC